MAKTRSWADIPPEAAAAYREAGDAMIQRVDRAILVHPDVTRWLGKAQSTVLRGNHRNHYRFMNAVFRFNDPELLRRTLPWVYRSYRGRGVSLDYFPASLSAWMQAVEAELPPDLAAPILAVYRFMLDHHDGVVAAADVLPPSTGTEDGEWNWAPMPWPTTPTTR